MRGFVLGAPSSGAGKTTIASAVIAALVRRGLTVQPFKIGPDFLDPGHLAAAAGRPCHALDPWLAGEEAVRERAARSAAGADLVVVEGAMGLFDGVDGRSEAGSTAAVAKLLGLPVVLVVDASAAARSLAALVHGFATFDPDLPLAGVVATKVGGTAHVGMIRDALGAAGGPLLLGALPFDPAAAVPERYLGLHQAAEPGPDGTRLAARERLDRLAALAEQHLDLERLARLEADPGRWPAGAPLLASAAPPRHRPAVRIGLAHDLAFSFYYPANLERLEAAGAELVFFSPTADPALPPALDGLYLGGGYPELHAAALAANRSMIESVRDFAAAGRPIYAECGGLLYLADRLVDAAGTPHAMVGALPGAVAAMSAGLVDFGYVEVETIRPTPLGPAGSRLRGHRFHCSRLVSAPAGAERAYRLRRPDGAPWGEEGFFLPVPGAGGAAGGAAAGGGGAPGDREAAGGGWADGGGGGRAPAGWSGRPRAGGEPGGRSEPAGAAPVAGGLLASYVHLLFDGTQGAAASFVAAAAAFGCARLGRGAVPAR